MGYHVEFVEPVLDYLAQVDGLTDDDRLAIIDGIIEELSPTRIDFSPFSVAARRALLSIRLSASGRHDRFHV